MAEPQMKRSGPGEEFPILGSGLDAPTVFADGIGGLTVDAHTAKIFLYEKVNDGNGNVVGKVTTNLTLSRGALDQMVDILTMVVEQIRIEEQK